MEAIAVLLMPLVIIAIPVLIVIMILYYVIKAAVRNGILEAKVRQREIDEHMSTVICPKCGQKYGAFWLKCPFCSQENTHVNSEEEN